MNKKYASSILLFAGLTLLTCSTVVTVMHNSNYINYNYLPLSTQNSKNGDDQTDTGADMAIKKPKRTRVELVSNLMPSSPDDDEEKPVKKVRTARHTTVDLEESLSVSTEDGTHDSQANSTQSPNKIVLLTDVLTLQTSHTNQKISEFVQPESGNIITVDRTLNPKRIKQNGEISDFESSHDQYYNIAKLLQQYEDQIFQSTDKKSQTDIVSLDASAFPVFITIEDSLQKIESSFTVFVHSIPSQDGSLFLVLLVPVSGYILIRSENEKIKIKNQPKFLSSFFIVILLSSTAITPFSISGNYWWMAFADNGTGSVTPATAPNSTAIHIPKGTETIQNQTVSAAVSSNTVSSSLAIHDGIATILSPSRHNSIETSNSTYMSNYTRTANSTVSINPGNHTNADTISISDALAATVQSTPGKTSSSLGLSDSVSATVSTSKPNSAAVALPNATESFNFMSNVGTTGKASTKNGTLQLRGQGYLSQNVNSTNNLQAFSISAWVQPDYTQGSPVFTVISKENQFMITINNNINPRHVAQFSIFDGIKWDTVNSTGTIPQGDWTHLAATYNGTDIAMYVNGTLQSQIRLPSVLALDDGHLVPVTPDHVSSKYDVVIGAQVESIRNSVHDQFSGQIKNVSIYDTLLGQSQILQMYNNAVAIPIRQIVPLRDNYTASDSLQLGDSIQAVLNSTNNTSDNTTSLQITPTIQKTKASYSIGDSPEFSFKVFSDSDLKKIKGMSRQAVQQGGWTDRNSTITAKITSPNGTDVPVATKFTKIKEGQFDIKVTAKRIGKPGLYTIKITLVKGGTTYSTQDQYAWGLVSLNTDRSIYRPGQTANMTIVVLDNQGHPVCDADMSMGISDPNGIITALSSAKGITAGECGIYNAQYRTGSAGNYTVNVSAISNGTKTDFATSFLVQNSFAFDIVRTAQSKIDPVNNPNLFNVRIDITPYVNATSTTIQESVPAVFNITSDASVQTVGDTKVLTWNRNLSGNSTSVQYSYSVPLVFPQMYALGPLKIAYGTQSFTEARQWFVANDPATFNSGSAVTGIATCTSKSTLGTLSIAARSSGTADNLLIGTVQITGTSTTATPVTVDITDGTTVLSQNTFNIDTGTSNSAVTNTYTLLGKDTTGSAKTYTLEACRTGGSGASAQGKLVMLNSMNNNAYVDSDTGSPGGVSLTAGSATQVATTGPTSLPAGTNVVIAEVQLQNNGGSSATVAAGNIDLTGSGTTSNSMSIILATTPTILKEQSILLIGTDTGAAGQSYSVSITAPASSTLQGAAKIMVVQPSDPPVIGNSASAVSIGTSATSLFTAVPTTFSTTDNVVAIANEELSTTSTARTLTAANDKLNLGTTAVTTNNYAVRAQATGSTYGYDTAWAGSPSANNAALGLTAVSSGAGVTGFGTAVEFKVASHYEADLTDSAPLSDSSSMQVTRSLSDTLALSDAASTIKVQSVSVSDSLSLADSAPVSKARTASIFDSFALSDTEAQSRSISRALSDSLATSDLPISASAVRTISLVDSVVLGDTSNSASAKSVFLSDSASLGDTVGSAKSRSISLSDSMQLGDAMEGSREITRSVTDAMLLGDTVATPREITVPVSDAMQFGDTVATPRSITALISDSVSSSDTVQSSKSRSISFSDSMQLGDAMESPRAISRSVSDLVPVGDTLTTPRTVTRSLSDSISVGDAAQFPRMITTSSSDSVSVSDVLAFAKSRFVLLADSVSLEDTIKSPRAMARSVSDSISLGDAAATPKSVTSNVSDSVSFADLTEAPRKIALSVSDAVPLGDATGYSKFRIVSLADAVLLADATVSPKSVFISVTDGVLFGDTIAYPRDVSSSVLDSMPISDKVGSPRSVTRYVLDAMPLGESIDYAKSKIVSLSDTTGLSDTMESPRSVTRYVLDAMPLGDTVGVPRTITTYTSDAVALGDKAAKQATISKADGMTISSSSTEAKNLADNQELIANGQKSVTVDPSSPQLVVVSNNTALSDIVIPSSVKNPTINYSSIQESSNGKTSVLVNNSLTISKDTSGDARPDVKITIPSNTTVSGNSWDAVLTLPTIQDASSISLPESAGQVNTPQVIIKIGADTPLSFDKPVRLLLTGQAGTRVGFYHSSQVTEITETCTSDSVSGIPSGSNECKISTGQDLAVWTNHFTGFATWSSSPGNSVHGTTSSSGGGSIGTGAGTAASSPSEVMGEGAGPYLEIQNISYDTCSKQIVEILVATEINSTDPAVILRTSATGVVSAKLVPVQPYAQENAGATVRKLVYEASISPKETSFEIVALESINHNIFSVGKTVEVTGCSADLDYTKAASYIQPAEVDLAAPRIFDVRYQVGNGSNVEAHSSNQFVDSGHVSIHAIIDTDTPISKAVLRFASAGQDSKYGESDMNVVPLQISNTTYVISGTIPQQMLQPPAITYWINVENGAGRGSDSAHYTLGIKPAYPITGSLEMDVTAAEREDSGRSSAYFTNSGAGPIYGSVVVTVDGTDVYTSSPQIFGTGQTRVDASWHMPIRGTVMQHSIQARLASYGQSIPTAVDKFTTFPGTRTYGLSDIDDINSESIGNYTVAQASTLYSSHISDDSAYQVIAPDGTCVIGQKTGCLVTSSTIGFANHLNAVTVSDQIYQVRYSGPDSSLERFTIMSVDPIVGQWKVTLEPKAGSEFQAHAAASAVLKVKYTDTNTDILTLK